MANKVLVIGLDGAEPSLLFKWASEGELPNLEKLINEGSSGNLKTTYPPMTAPAWTSFMTGKNPGNTGIFDFVQKTPGKYEQAELNSQLAEQEGGVEFSVITSNMVKHKRIWEIINEANKKVGVIHVPMSYPPDNVDGFMISGLGTPGPNSDFTHPPELRDRLLNEFGYKIHVSHLNIDGIEDKAIADLYSTEEKRTEVAIELMKENEWEFFMLVFEGTDYVQHFFWKFMDPNHPHFDPKKASLYQDTIFNYYKKVDYFFGKILENIDENVTVVVMSDHGGGPVYQNFYVNNWLMDLDLLKLKSKQTHSNIISKVGFNKEFLYGMLIKIISPKVIAKIPLRIRNLVPKKNYSIKDFDWSKTKVFSLTGWGMIYINLKGREIEGIVDQEGYEELREIVINELKELKDQKSGENLVQLIYKKEELYQGKYYDQAPDLVFWMEGIDCIDEVHSNNSPLFIDSDKRKSGNHRMEGVILAKGNGIKKNHKIDSAQIIDLAPTILYSMGIPVHDDMDGKVLEDIFDTEFLQKNEVIFKEIEKKEKLIERTDEKVLSQKDEEKIKERLRALGYID